MSSTDLSALFYHPSKLKWQEGIKLTHYSYPKYGKHIVAIKCLDGGNKQIFDAIELFAEEDTYVEYERVKDEAALFAEQFVNQFNDANSKGEAQ